MITNNYKFVRGLKTSEYELKYWTERPDSDLEELGIQFVVNEKNQKVNGCFGVTDYHGVELVTLYWLNDGDTRDVVGRYPNAAFSSGHYSDMIPCNTKNYVTRNHMFVLSECNKDVLVNIFEDKFVFKKSDSVDNIKFLNMNMSSFRKFISEYSDRVFGIPAERSDNGFYKWPGFHYFEIENYVDDNIYYLVAVDKNTRKIAGVIFYGQWPNSGKVICISYIDVAAGAKNRGVATKMVKELNKILKDNPVRKFRIGSLSDEGKKCHIDKVFRENIEGFEFVD